MDHVLDVGRRSQPVTQDDKPPYALFNKVEMLGLTLPILVNYPSNHTFRNQGLGMLWDSTTSNWEDPFTNEHEYCT
jgi:hypothetical protein